MNATTATADAPSLTLPDWRAALKRRIKRPKLPDRTLLLIAGLQVLGLVAEVVLGLIGAGPGTFIIAAGFGCELWVTVRKMRRGEASYIRNPADRVLSSLFWPCWAAGGIVIFAGLFT